MKRRNKVPLIDGLRIDEAHKGGNPFKSAVKAVKKAVSQTSSELSRTGDTLSKVGSAAAGAIQDPGTWTAYLINPALGGAVGGQGAIENYQALSQAEKDEARAEAMAREAAAKEKAALEKEKAAQAKQAEMVKSREDKAKKAAAERATRLGTGRRGLLYQGKETGVTKSTKLGG